MPIAFHLRRCTAVVLLAVLATAGPAGHAAGENEHAAVHKDARVANFVAAERMDGGHPPVTLSFWSGPHGKVINYDPGDGSGSIRLQPLGRTADRQGLRVRTPDGSTWAVTPSEGVLLLDDNRGPRRRIFLWQYQGPVDGRGTACHQCVPEEQALQFVVDAFVLQAP